ncbi:MAG: peptidylprolyl isomerase [Ignavibacteriae bacterium HGW-Ignavibacteriae-3]|nr:MAG: peptidylprolyl isomerase [Ignavibacteriae bacterium HGW-Ignavibacteriae-3]
MKHKKNILLIVSVVVLSISTACKPKVIASSDEGASADNLLNVGEREVLAAVVETNKGTIELELFAGQTPKTVENFVRLSMNGYYSGIIFHRVIKDFMIQSGDPAGTGEGGESIFGKFFADEIVPNIHFDDPGMLAMANKGPNTNGSQFFITTVTTPWLDRRHTIFGKVLSGMDVVMEISKVKVDQNEKPIVNITINKIVIQKRAR